MSFRHLFVFVLYTVVAPAVKACILLGHGTKWCWFLSFSCFYFVWHEILSYPTRSWMKDWFLTEGNGWLPECLWASHPSWGRQAENRWDWSASQTCVVKIGFAMYLFTGIYFFRFAFTLITSHLWSRRLPIWRPSWRIDNMMDLTCTSLIRYYNHYLRFASASYQKIFCDPGMSEISPTLVCCLFRSPGAKGLSSWLLY